MTPETITYILASRVTLLMASAALQTEYKILYWCGLWWQQHNFYPICLTNLDESMQIASYTFNDVY